MSAPERLHVAIIMDGNGRWATARGWPRVAGHRAGGDTVRRVIEAAPGCGIGTLTLYAFSADNWTRPRREVSALMELLGDYLQREVARCIQEGVRLHFIGRRDRLPARLVSAMRAAESATAAGRVLQLRLAIDYSARDAIVRAAQRLKPGEELTREAFTRLIAEGETPESAAPEVDLLIRTGGEQRLSDFLLWESAYAELCFTPTMWPDFSVQELEAAVQEFHARQRRFGGLPEQAAS
jgi:undecaprenyl diphosphate synthase